MALCKEEKNAIIKKFAKKEGDTGSSEVQIALLTAEINYLNKHFEVHKHDFHSRRGLMMKVGHRRSLLRYLKKKDYDSYVNLTKELGLRK